jgi:hypothetical protein
MFHRNAGNMSRKRALNAAGIILASSLFAPMAKADDAMQIKSVDIYPSQLLVLTQQGDTMVNYQCGVARTDSGIAARHEFDGEEITTETSNGGGQAYSFYFRGNFPEGLVDVGCQGYQGSDDQRRVHCQMNFQNGSPAQETDCAADADWGFSGCMSAPVSRQMGDVGTEVKKIGAKCDAIRNVPTVAQQLDDPNSTTVVESEAGPKGIKLQEFNRNRASILLNAAPR